MILLKTCHQKTSLKTCDMKFWNELKMIVGISEGQKIYLTMLL